MEAVGNNAVGPSRLSVRDQCCAGSCTPRDTACFTILSLLHTLYIHYYSEGFNPSHHTLPNSMTRKKIQGSNGMSSMSTLSPCASSDGDSGTDGAGEKPSEDSASTFKGPLEPDTATTTLSRGNLSLGEGRQAGPGRSFHGGGSINAVHLGVGAIINIVSKNHCRDVIGGSFTGQPWPADRVAELLFHSWGGDCYQQSIQRPHMHLKLPQDFHHHLY
jgi:hypothetical protein